MQQPRPTQAAWAAASGTPSPRPEHARQADRHNADRENSNSNNSNESTSANEQASGASNELIGEEASRSLAFEAANRTSTPLNADFDQPTNDEEEYDDEATTAAAATSASPTAAAPDDGADEGEPGVRRRASLMASLVPDNKRLAALLAGKGPLSSELRKLAKSSGLSRAIAERARRRNRASTAKPTPKAAQKQSSASQRTHAPAAKSMQTRQGLATTMASSSHGHTHALNAANLAHHLAGGNNHLKQQLKMMSAAGGGGGGATLPQLSSAIQRLISLGKFGGAGGGVAASPQQQQQMLLAHLNNMRNNQTMTAPSDNGHNGGHQKRPPSYHDHGDFSLTSASDAGDSSPSTGVGRLHGHPTADDSDGELLPFELASASALPGEQQVPPSELDDPGEIGRHQLPWSSARLAELVGRWQAQMPAGPPEVATGAAHDGGLLSLQAAQQRNKLAAAAAGHSLLDLPTSGPVGGGGGATNKQQLIPVEIIGLDPSVTNSILYGSIRQQQQHARRLPAPLQPLLSATSQQDHYQQMDAHAAPPGGDYAHQQHPSGSQAGGELDIRAPSGEQQDGVYSSVVTGARGQKLLDSDPGGGGLEPPPDSSHGRPPVAPSKPKQSPVLHVHHFHHTSNEPATPAGQQQEQDKTIDSGQQDNVAPEPAAGQPQVVSGTGAHETTVMGTAGESDNVEQAQEGSDPTASSDGHSQSHKAKMRFVSNGASLRGKQAPQPPADGRPPRLAKAHSSLYASSNEDEEQEQPNYDSQSDHGPSTNLLMVSYKPAGPAQQLNYQQHQLYTGSSSDQDQPSPGASHSAESGHKPNFPPPYNEGSESKYSSSAPSNLSMYGNGGNSTANLLRSLMRQQQQHQFQIKLAGPNEAGQWSGEDERLLNQFNLAHNHRPPARESQYQHLPVMMASSGGPAAESTASRPGGAQNPFQNHYQQFVDNLAMLKQLRLAQQQQQRPTGQPRLVPNRASDTGPVGAGNFTNEPALVKLPLEPAHFPHSLNATTNGRYELASASDRFASKLRATNTGAQHAQSQRAAQTLFTANDNFHVPNTSTSTSTNNNNNKSAPDSIVTRQQPPVQPPDTPPAQVDPGRAPTKQAPGSSQDQVHAPSEMANFMDSTNGLSNLALAFIFVVSLLTFILIAASLIYRRRRGRVRYGPSSLVSGRGDGGGPHQTGAGQPLYKSTGATIGQSGAGRLNLTRAKHLMRSSFVGENLPDTTDQSNVSSLKSVSRLGAGAASGKSHLLNGNGQPGHQNTITVQQRQLKSVLKQPSQQKQQELSNNNNSSSQHNYVNKYVCANSGQRQSGPSKASRFFGFGAGGSDKYQSGDDESTANGTRAHDATPTSTPDSDIKTLNTRLSGQPPMAAAGGKHPMGHKRVAASSLTVQRGGASGAKYKNYPPTGQQGQPPPAPVACLKHAML